MNLIIGIVLNFLKSNILYITSVLPSVWKFIKQYYKYIILAVIIISIVAVGYFYISSLNKSIYYWQNQAAKRRTVNQVAPNVYEAQSSYVDQQKLENEKLQKRLSETERKADAAISLALKYQIKIDSIKTYFANMNNSIKIDSTQRFFKYNLPGELSLNGRFQIIDPYQLFVDSLKLILGLDISLSQAKDGSWWTDVDAKSPHLNPEQINVKVFPRSVPWEWFTGLNMMLNGTEVKGLYIHGGIKRGSLAGELNVGTLYQAGFYYGLGFTKYFEF